MLIIRKYLRRVQAWIDRWWDKNKHVQIYEGMPLRHEFIGPIVSIDPKRDVIVAWRNYSLEFECRSGLRYSLSQIRHFDGRNLHYFPSLFAKNLWVYFLAMVAIILICMPHKFYALAGLSLLIPLVPQIIQHRIYSKWLRAFPNSPR